MHRTGIIAVATGDAVNRVVILNRHFNIRRGTSGNTGQIRGFAIELNHRIGELRTGGMMILARHTAIGQRVPAIRGDVDLEDRLVKMQQVHRVVARLERLILVRREAVVAQQDDTVVVVAQPEFALGGAHAVGHMPIGLARFYTEITGQHSSRQRDDNLLAGSHIRRTAHDAARHLVAILIDGIVLLADVHMAPVDGLAVLLRFRRGIHHIADHNRTDHLRGMDLLLFKADLDEILRKLFVRQTLGNLDMFLEPVNINHRHGSITPPLQTVR